MLHRSNSPAHYAKGTPSRIAVNRHSAPTACRRTVSGTISLPLKGFFSPFPHGTSSLSVAGEYLALEGGPPGFTRDFTCPALLRYALGPFKLRLQGFHLLRQVISSTTSTRLQGPISCALQPLRASPQVWAIPRSLAATCGISFDFSSSGY